MYRPQHFKVDDLETLKDFIASYPLGALISQQENSLQMNYLPFVFDSDSDSPTLIAHAAKNNPQMTLLDRSHVVISFKGPDRYISPSWYESTMEVPTWNYAAVEVRGRAELITSFEGIEEILNKSVQLFEKRNQTTWSYELPQKFREGLVRAIVGMKIHIESIEGKFKLSQNRKDPDQLKVQKYLEESPNTNDQEMFQWIRKITC